MTPSNPPTQRLAKQAAVGLGGTSIAAAVLYYLLTCVSAQSDRIQAVEVKVDAVHPALVKLEARSDETLKQVNDLSKSIGRIEGYMAAQQDKK